MFRAAEKRRETGSGQDGGREKVVNSAVQHVSSRERGRHTWKVFAQ